MRNSFELLDWLKEHLGGSGGAADVLLADSVTPGIVKLTHEVSHEEAEHTAVAPDGVAAYAEGKFVPLVQKSSHHESVMNETTAGSATCEECASGVLMNLNMSVTAGINTVVVSFPLDHAERFSDAQVQFLINGAWYNVRKNGLNLTLTAVSQLTQQSCRATVFVPYF